MVKIVTLDGMSALKFSMIGIEISKFRVQEFTVSSGM